jgi:hypothetical protein
LPEELDVGLMDCWITGFMDGWNTGLLDYWIDGLLEYWNIGILERVSSFHHSIDPSLHIYPSIH